MTGHKVTETQSNPSGEEWRQRNEQYHRALSIELTLRGISFHPEVVIPALYKEHPIGEYRLDFLIEDAVVVEIKAVEQHHAFFEAQILTYLRVSKKRLGLLINSNSRLLTEGIRRFVL